MGSKLRKKAGKAEGISSLEAPVFLGTTKLASCKLEDVSLRGLKA